MQGDVRPSWMRPDEEERSFWKIVWAVVLGILIAGAIGAAIRLYFVHAALQEFNSVMASIARQSAEQTRQMRREQEAAAFAARAQEAQRVAAAAAQQRAIEEAKRTQLASAQAKEDAWGRYYRKPARCENADGQVFVDCANEYIRAKRKFEELYAAGKL